MEKCFTCENEYDKLFEINKENKRYLFDSFECAIQALSPSCAHCSCKIIGHGVESANIMYCCANCARQEGVQALADRTE